MKGQSKMNHPETLIILGTEDTGRSQTKHRNTTQKAKKMSNTEPSKTWGSTQLFAKGKQFLPLKHEPLAKQITIYINITMTKWTV